MKEARGTWPAEGRGADGGDRMPATPSQPNAPGFLKDPQIIKTEVPLISVFSQLKGRLFRLTSWCNTIS